MTTLGDGLIYEMRRVREMIPIYARIPHGAFAISRMQESLGAAEKAAIHGDVVAMAKARCLLERYEGI